MAQVHFTPNLQRHLDCPSVSASGTSVRAVLDAVFTEHPNIKHYIVDDQGRIRKHVALFVDGQLIRDRDQLTDRVTTDSELFIMQALSGG